METDIKILLLPSCAWCIEENIRSLRSFLLHFEALGFWGFRLYNDINDAKIYLVENKVSAIIISDNLPINVEQTEDEKDLGLNFYEEIKQDPQYQDTPIVIQSFLESNKNLNLREIDFYYGPNVSRKDLDKFLGIK